MKIKKPIIKFKKNKIKSKAKSVKKEKVVVKTIGRMNMANRTPNTKQLVEKLGGVRPVAKAAQVCENTVYIWQARGTIPEIKARMIYDALGKECKVRPHDIRPDIFKKEWK